MQTDFELDLLSRLMKETNDIEGDVIEVGVYTGASAHILDTNRGNRKLYLYDTFDGFHDLGKNDPEIMQGYFKFDGVLDKINKEFPDADIIVGYFPDSAYPHKRLSFVHLDVDTYTSTLKSLEYVYPLLSFGGIVMTHDYVQPALGVKKAFDEFFSNKLEPIIKTDTSQAYITKQ